MVSRGNRGKRQEARGRKHEARGRRNQRQNEKIIVARLSSYENVR
jgi:hypothetical protein